MIEVKKAILLQLIGGVTKEASDGGKIRGEINLALIGDPGIAKSQILKHVARLAPRGIYTTGKGSSGVGLTAAVIVDPNTKEVSLEAGALVLADMGICCLDEFDKMQEYDRTAIHEVMEQQTVSIAKAGITTTLNARTSILAAANPLYGKYNPKASKSENINMPAALLTRFDLIFVLIDKQNKKRDLDLARHISNVHRNPESVGDKVGVFKEDFLRNYIAMAKKYDPTIKPSIMNKIQEYYVSKRAFAKENLSNDTRSHISSRYLVAIIRLAMAKAKLRFSNEVEVSDFEEAKKMLDYCDELAATNTVNPTKLRKEDKEVDQIFHAIKNLFTNKGASRLLVKDIESEILLKGFSREKYEEIMKFYIETGVFHKEGHYLITDDKMEEEK